MNLVVGRAVIHYTSINDKNMSRITVLLQSVRYSLSSTTGPHLLFSQDLPSESNVLSVSKPTTKVLTFFRCQPFMGGYITTGRL